MSLDVLPHVGRHRPMSEVVQPRRAAVVAGVLVGLYVIALFLATSVPDRVVSLLGGPDGGVDRLGGLRVRYRPPPGSEATNDASLVQRSTARREGDALVLEFPGIAEEVVPDVIDTLVAGGFVMREALESRYAEEIGAGDDVVLDLDQWRADDGGPPHAVGYLRAPTREALEQAVAAARARGVRFEGAEVAYERVDAFGGHDDREPYWRTYALAPEILIDGTMVANAMASYDPNTNRPIVLLDFTRAGAERFCDASRRLIGNKVAMVLGGRIRSAPIIESAICGGRVSITMGGVDPVRQQREAEALVAVLAHGGLPPGGTIEDPRWQPPADITAQEWAGRLLLGLVAGLVFGLATMLVIRFVRPRWRAEPPRIDGRFPVRRLVVTLLAPVALIVGAMVTVPGINTVELEHVLARAGHGLDLEGFSVIALGVMPILSAFFLVELVALAVPRLRWRRHDPVGRVRLGQAVAALSIVCALVQGCFLAIYLESLSRGGAEVIAAPGWGFRGLVMVSLAAGTMALGILAGMIREHGLGNGYGVLIIAGFVVDLVWLLIREPDALVLFATPGHLLGLVTAIAIAVGTGCVLRWRIAGAEREPVLRLPTSGRAPLADAGGLVFLIVTLSALGLGEALEATMQVIFDLRANTWLTFAIVIISIPIWSWVFARPAVIERLAMQAGLPRVSRASWVRATWISAALLVTIWALWSVAVTTDAAVVQLAEPLTIMIGAAVVLDLIDDARAHRRKLAPAGVLHQIQYAGVVERVLGDAGIPCHIHASHLRTLFAFFGPFAPAIVLVPEELAAAARSRVTEVTALARARVPAARVSTGVAQPLDIGRRGMDEDGPGVAVDGEQITGAGPAEQAGDVADRG